MEQEILGSISSWSKTCWDIELTQTYGAGGPGINSQLEQNLLGY